LADPAAEDELIEKISEWNGGHHTRDELAEALNRLRQSKYWLTSYQPTNAAHGALKNLTSELIGRFVSKTTNAIVDSSPAESLARFGSFIVVPDEVKVEISALKGIVSAFLMSSESRRPYYEWQRALLVELADALLAANGENLDPYSSSAWAQAKTEIEQRRVIVDQVASLTDQSALNLHARLVGKTA